MSGLSVTRVVKFIRKGAAGNPAPYVELSRTSVLYKANNDGYSVSTSAQRFDVDCSLKVNGEMCTIASSSNIIITSIPNVTASKTNVSSGVSTISLIISPNKQISGVVTIQMTGTLNGVSYTAKGTITIEPNCEGQQGQQGEQGEQGEQGDAAVEYSISLAGSTFARDPETETIYVDIKGKVYKTVGGNQQEYSSLSRSNLSLYFLKTDGTTDSVPNVNNIDSGYTVSGNTFATKFYNNSGYANEQVFVVELTVGNHTAKASLQITKYGDKGDKGDSAPTALASPDKITISCNNNGTVKSQTVTAVTFSLKVGNNSATVTSCADGTKPTGVTVQGVYTNAVTITVGTNATASGMAAGVTFTVTGTYGGKTYSATVTVALIGTIEGAQGPTGPQGPTGGTGGTGPRGYRGPSLRGPQDWEQMEVGYQFYKGDEATQEPYEDFVLLDGTYYKCKQTHTKQNSHMTINQAGKKILTSTYWQISDKIAMVAANVLFAKHGYFGSAIISGDWLISTNGMIDNTFCENGATYQGIIAYSLFNENNPSGDDVLIYGSSTTQTKTASETTKTIATVSLEAGKLYYLKATGKAGSASGQYYIRVRNTSTGTTNTPVMINGTSNVTRSGYFSPGTTGSYYLEFYDTSGISAEVSAIELTRKDFAPTFALDLLTGTTYQHDGVFTGFIRKGKTKITTSNIDNYKRTDITEATVLDFDKCGSFIELSTGTASYFSLPLLSSAIASRYTAAQKDRIRSFIGTKLLVYNNSGANLSITWKWITSGGVYGYTLYNGNCVELECKMDKDDGDNGTEVIYWEVIKTAEPV